MRTLALPLALAFWLMSACSPTVCPSGFYAGNVKIVEKGVSKENEPRGMSNGTLWASGAGGFLRFTERATWEGVEVGRFYTVQFSCEGWVISMRPSAVDSSFIIVGDR